MEPLHEHDIFFFFVFTHILITIIITVYVLKNSLIWLNDWEINLANYLINRGSVFNKNTTEGFRIKSSIDLINQLHNCGFDYVLISKIIQDCIERFFGIIRQISGSNYHPSIQTFLQLYRMLSVYSVIKPNKSENRTILEDNAPIISLNDFKNIINDQDENLERQTKLINLKK
ncbi:THAP-type domain-containing protein [Aphis craccivora]|uniref:THAP-type domain-containing protein n=1 Tax=Aphis craccivora TaxID=307492 RepID=A0A6G0X0D0_APHCR|nr:THAP-type domain-containing protein [Aphis craccivora]